MHVNRASGRCSTDLTLKVHHAYMKGIFNYIPDKGVSTVRQCLATASKKSDVHININMIDDGQRQIAKSDKRGLSACPPRAIGHSHLQNSSLLADSRIHFGQTFTCQGFATLFRGPILSSAAHSSLSIRPKEWWADVSSS